MLCGEAASWGKAESPLSSTLALWISKIKRISDRKPLCNSLSASVAEWNASGCKQFVSHYHLCESNTMTDTKAR